MASLMSDKKNRHLEPYLTLTAKVNT